MSSNAFSDALENAIIEYFFRNGSPSVGHVTTLYVALSTGTPNDASTGASMSEVTNSNNYSRQAISFDAAVAGATSNGSDIVFTASGGGWGTISGLCIVDSGTYGQGNVLMYDAAMSSVDIADGDTLTFAAGDIDVTVD